MYVCTNVCLGIGMWQTVSVREVDDEAERAENARLMEEMFNRRDDQNAV